MPKTQKDDLSAEQMVLGQILSRLNKRSGYFVEFGAWDGIHLSLTHALRKKGWSGLLIEADAEKFSRLRENVTEPSVRTMHCRVDVDGADTLDAILTRAGAPKAIDVLSIDIDSDDLAVWSSLKLFRSDVVVIEYNVTIPFDIDFVNPKGHHWGNSAAAILRHASRCNYLLLAFSGMNLVFVDTELCRTVGLTAIALDPKLASSAPRYFWGYDGTLLTSGLGNSASEILQVPWHEFVYPQPMPAFLRRWRIGREWRFAERFVSAIGMLAVRPATLFKHLFGRRG